jgi:hypothetical protein
MQKAEGLGQKGELEKNRIRRRKRRVENQGQLVLVCGGGERRLEEKKTGEERRVQRKYDDPSPEGILIGREDLRSFLQMRGETAAIQIRELVRGLPLKGFHKKPPKAGRRPYHPASMLGLILFGILEGRSSLRQLETMARTDIRSWWIGGGIHPDHSVIGRFIQHHAAELSEKFFIELTKRVLELTGGRGGDLSGDGTIVQAAGSRYRRLSKEAAEEAEREAEEAYGQAPEDDQLGRRAEEAHQVAEAARHRAEAQRRHGSRGKIEVNASEPEAVVQPLKNKRGMAASYKPVVFSNEQQMVVAQTVHPSCEHAAYAQLLDQAQRTSGEVTQIRLDSGYCNFEVMEESEGRGICLLCPEAENSSGGKKRKKFPKSEFRYDAKGDYYECPAGHRLVRTGAGGVQRGRAYHRYGEAPCQQCEKRGQCTSSRKGRLVKRYAEEELKEQLRARMQDPLMRQEYEKRRHMVEPVFARIKEHQGLKRFRRKGLRQVQVEFALHAAVHNLGRLLALVPALTSFLGTIQRLLRQFLGHFRADPGTAALLAKPQINLYAFSKTRS